MKPNQKPNTERKIFMIFFGILALFLVLNLADLHKYGMTWDEDSQRGIGQGTKAYLQGQTSQFEQLKVRDLAYYGPFFETVNQYFAPAVEKLTGIDDIDAFHILVVVTAGLGLLFLFLLVSELFDQRIALYACVLLMLVPYFVAHAHYNSKEIPLFAGFTSVLYFLYIGFRHRQISKIIIGGAVFGLVLATRLDSIIILPVFFLSYAVYLIFEKKVFTLPNKTKIILTDMLLVLMFFFIALAVMYLAWPELWHNPKLAWDALKYLIHVTWPFKVLVLYFGKFYLTTDLPWHYSPFFLLATTPLVILGLFFTGLYAAGRSLRLDKKYFAYSLLFFWLMIRLGLDLLPHAVRYDGIRHYLPEVPVLMIVAALGLNFILEKIPTPKRGVYYPAIFLAILGWLLVEFFIVYPFGGSYLNEPTRLALGDNLGKELEVEYWASPYRQGIDWLNLNADPNAIVCVPVSDDLIAYYQLRDDISDYCPKKSNYLMILNRPANIPASLEDFFQYEDRNPVYTISRYGVPLLYIYYLRPVAD